jgi:S-disulfanyl-L-cysteine oxidoreductase SoxD
MRRSITLISLLSMGLGLTAETRTVWDGVYTKEQAARGNQTYRRECQRCHAENLLGGEDATALLGKDFLEAWSGRTVAELYELTRKTMPTDGPASLSRQAYSDVVAFILSSNEFPAGAKELPTDSAPMADIKIEPKK